jgi:hypothetical protein
MIHLLRPVTHYRSRLKFHTLKEFKEEDVACRFSGKGS